MLVTGYEDSPRGSRYIIIEDVVGGHALSDSDIGRSASSYPLRRGGDLRVLALWSYWPEEVDDDELPFPKGAEIREYENINDDWSWGVYCSRKGFFLPTTAKRFLKQSIKLPRDMMKALVVTKRQWCWNTD